MKLVLRVTASDPAGDEGVRLRDALSRDVTIATFGVTVEARHSEHAPTP